MSSGRLLTFGYRHFDGQHNIMFSIVYQEWLLGTKTIVDILWNLYILYIPLVPHICVSESG